MELGPQDVLGTRASLKAREQRVLVPRCSAPVGERFYGQCFLSEATREELMVLAGPEFPPPGWCHAQHPALNKSGCDRPVLCIWRKMLPFR